MIGLMNQAADLQAQLEEILDAVWKSEADWRLNDRIALAVRLADAPGSPSAQRRPDSEGRADDKRR